MPTAARDRPTAFRIIHKPIQENNLYYPNIRHLQRILRPFSIQQSYLDFRISTPRNGWPDG
jgi:hypothetical protein